MRLFLDTNILIDYLLSREPFCLFAKKVLCLGRLHEFNLWCSSSQASDIAYFLTDGGKPSLAQSAKETMLALFEVVEVYPLEKEDIYSALNSEWEDIEDAFVYEAALSVKADAILTRDKGDYVLAELPVYTCDEWFSHLAEEGITYHEIAW